MGAAAPEIVKYDWSWAITQRITRHFCQTSYLIELMPHFVKCLLPRLLCPRVSSSHRTTGVREKRNRRNRQV